MATLQFTVYNSAAEVALGDPIQEGVVTIGASSAQSAMIAGADRKRRRVRIFCDAKSYVTWGANPTALADGTGGRLWPEENYEYVDIEAGHRIAVIERP